MENSNKKQHLWDTFDTVQPTTIPPTHNKANIVIYDDILKQTEKLYEEYNLTEFYQYKKGALLQPSADTDYTQLLRNCIKLIFQCIREDIQKTTDNEEDKQDILIKVSNLEASMTGLVQLLKSFNFKLDKDSVCSIMHGYINEIVKPKFKNYETKRSSKHRRVGSTSG